TTSGVVQKAVFIDYTSSVSAAVKE
ncbi:MAG: hypothetical protein ACJA1E_000711, partial [Paracoccaceae bacterium]